MPIPMKAALQYVDQQNRMRKIFGQRELELMKDAKLIHDMVEGDLSPENLSCDGELRGRALDTKARFLNQVKADIFCLVTQRA